MDAPSMVQRSGDALIVRSVVSGNQLYVEKESKQSEEFDNIPTPELNPIEDSFANYGDLHQSSDISVTSGNLPQCKIKRNYSCNSCTYFTQNPRHFLTHLKEVHGEKIVINACKYCLYASRHYQKLVRHMKMVHGSTDGLEEQALSRKRASQLAREMKKRKSSLGDLQQQHQMRQQQQIQLQIQRQYQQNEQLQQTEQSSAVADMDVMDTHSVESYGSSPEPPTMVSLGSDLYHPETGSSSPDNNKLLKCTVCDYSTYWRVQLADHERDVHHKTKFFRCEKCSYVTHIKARFSKHVKYHSMPMIKCVMCDFRTPYKWNLDRHMKNHGGTGLYKCSACNFTADIKQSLTVHEMNHHVPPVGHASGMSMARRKNKVGGTDIVDQFPPMNFVESRPSIYITDSSMNVNLIDNIRNHNINEKQSNKYSGMESFNEPQLKKIRLEAPADLSINKSTGSVDTHKKSSRPIPNLIPIQTPVKSPPPPNTSLNTAVMNLSLPGRNVFSKFATAMYNKNVNDICPKSTRFIRSNEGSLHPETIISQLSPLSNASSSSTSKSINNRKPGNFFEELKEKLNGRDTSSSLVCACGHLAKCLSEKIIHQKNCTFIMVQSPVNLSALSTSLGSTRCQYCRQRCKSSSDLHTHLQHCIEVRSTSNGDSIGSSSNFGGSNEKIDISEDCIDEEVGEDDEDSESEPHPMENRVFIWNKSLGRNGPTRSGNNKVDPLSAATQVFQKREDDRHLDRSEDSEHDDVSYYGVETAPGYGEVTKKLSGATIEEEEIASASLKKVFKCPHCSFWASTASRFHVHIVGHLNKKPFECSLCSYRSNWRWDITKHIRLKTIRDPSHKNARVLMNDETGRRNYTKYNKHITLMKVTDEDGDPKLLKSGEMTPSQEAALSFIGQNSSDSHRRTGPGSEDGLESSESALALVKSVGHRHNDGPEIYVEPSNIISNETNTLTADVVPAMILTGGTIEGHDGTTEIKKTTFKCKKCNYRHSNRDVVLTHVKGHYHDAGLLLDTKQGGQLKTLSKQIELPIFSNLLRLPITQPDATRSTSNATLHLQPSTAPSAWPQLPTQNIATDMSMNPATMLGSSVSTISMKPVSMLMQSSASPSLSPGSLLVTKQSTIENGEMDEASSLGSSVTGGRDPAPYRCGHCHQVSNWKHVIQRHCRLKHNGDINIELIEKGSRNRVYTRLYIAGSSIGINSDVYSKTGCQRNSNGEFARDDEEDVADDNISVPPNVSQINHCTHAISNLEGTEDGPNQYQLLNKKPKQCDHCSFTSPCRSQLELRQSGSHDVITSQNTELGYNDSNSSGGIINLDEEISPNLVLNKIIDSVEFSEPTEAYRSRPIKDCRSSGPTNKSSQVRLTTTIEKQINKIRELRSQIISVQSTDKPPSTNIKYSEKCPHCPFQTGRPDALMEHMQFHICVSGVDNLVNCDHCDFSVADICSLREHIPIHFNCVASGDLLSGSEEEERNCERKKNMAAVRSTRTKPTNVDFFVRYDSLVMSSSPCPEPTNSFFINTGFNNLTHTNYNKKHNHSLLHLHNEFQNKEAHVIFPLMDHGGDFSKRTSVDCAESTSCGSDKENLIIVDINSGEVLSKDRSRLLVP